MAIPWIGQLSDELAEREQGGLLRGLESCTVRGKWVERGGRRLLNLAGNDYLALTDHSTLKTAAQAAIEEHGTGSGASRLVTGHRLIHERVEKRFATFKHAEAALLLPTGYMANLAVITTLARPGDLICIDKLNHASIIDAAQASGATVRVFPHLNIDKLARLLERNAASPDTPRHSSSTPRSFIITDAIFSMDGDVADLPGLCDLADKHGATLIVDDAHGTGVLGENGAGLCEAQGVADRVDIVISTASKALGGLGGVVTGPRLVIEALVNAARSFIYTTAVPPAQAAVIEAALDVVRDEPERRCRLAETAGRIRDTAAESGLLPESLLSHEPSQAATTPIVPLIVGEPEVALGLSQSMAAAGIHCPAIRPPTVPRGTSRVRLSLRADLDDDDVSLIEETIRSIAAKV